MNNFPIFPHYITSLRNIQQNSNIGKIQRNLKNVSHFPIFCLAENFFRKFSKNEDKKVGKYLLRFWLFTWHEPFHCPLSPRSSYLINLRWKAIMVV